MEMQDCLTHRCACVKKTRGLYKCESVTSGHHQASPLPLPSSSSFFCSSVFSNICSLEHLRANADPLHLDGEGLTSPSPKAPEDPCLLLG